MKSLDKRDKQRIKEALTDLETAKGRIETDRAALDAAIEAFNEKVTEYNEALEAARGVRDDIVSAIDTYVGERSEKWAEGDRATAYGEWKQAWEDAELDDLDRVELDLENDYPMEHGDVLEQLPEAPE